MTTETLDYTSAQLTGTFAPGFANPVPDDYTQILGDVVLAQQLNPNQANQLVTPLSYSFGGLLNSAQASLGDTGCCAPFLFSTSQGNIVGWDIQVYNSSGGEAVYQSLISTAQGDSYVLDQGSPSCWFSRAVSCSSYSATSAQGGIWVDPPALAPELDFQAAFAAVSLLCGIALIARGRRALSP